MPLAAADLYPLSGQDGQPIPLHIVKPVSMSSYNMVKDVAAAISIPPGFSVVFAYSTVSCILRTGIGAALPSPLLNGIEYLNAIFIPAECPMTLNIPAGVGSLLGLATGKLFLSSTQQWGSITQDQQSRIG